MATTHALTIHSSTIGRKALMAVSGLVAVGWVFAHMLGQLGVYVGREAYNGYAAFLLDNPGLLWGQRVVFGTAIAVHVWAAVSLTRTNRQARAVHPHSPTRRATNAAALTMRYGGVSLLAFLVYHVLHLTVGLTGHLGYEFVKGDPYNNLVLGLQHPAVAGVYVLGQVALGMHLYHGLWSMTQTLGLSHPRYEELRERACWALAGVIVVGFVSVPVAVLTGAVTPVGR